MVIPAPDLTVAQVKRFPDDGKRYELVDGVLLVSPGPALFHQIVVGRLFTRLYNALMPRKLAWVVSIGEIERGRRLLVDPDILVYPRSYSPASSWKEIDGWWLAVEVESPSTRRHDHKYKRGAYLRVGVQEVWLVSARKRTLEVWTKAGHEAYVGGVYRWQPPALRGKAIAIDLDSLFSTDR